MDTELKNYTGQAGQVLKWMKQGLNQIQAAQAVGVTREYVSMLCSEEEFKGQIGNALKKDFEKALQIENHYRDIELTALEKLKEQQVFATSIDDNLKILRTVTMSKPKISVLPDNSHVEHSENNVIILNLPNAILQEITINPNSEVVAIGKRNLTTLNSSSLDSLAQKHLILENEAIQNEPIPKIDMKKHLEVMHHAELRPKIGSRWETL